MLSEAQDNTVIQRIRQLLTKCIQGLMINTSVQPLTLLIYIQQILKCEVTSIHNNMIVEEKKSRSIRVWRASTYVYVMLL